MLRAGGYKLTIPRLTVLDILEEMGGHLTSTELIDLVEQRNPTIGRATVFRTLDLLAQLGIVGKSAQSSSTISYVLMSGGHHHHLVCTHCQRVIEFPECELTDLLNLLRSRYGFHPESHLLEVYGLCAECKAWADNLDLNDSHDTEG